MLGIVGAIKAIGEVFKFAGTLTDAQQRRDRYELLLDKQAHKALNSAETIIHAIDSFFTGSITKRQFDYILKKHRKIFFAND